MMCRYMRANSLESIEQALRNPLPSQQIEIDPAILKKAVKCIDAMFYYSNL
jgi:quinolinate synthase